MSGLYDDLRRLVERAEARTPGTAPAAGVVIVTTAELQALLAAHTPPSEPATEGLRLCTIHSVLGGDPQEWAVAVLSDGSEIRMRACGDYAEVRTWDKDERCAPPDLAVDRVGPHVIDVRPAPVATGATTSEDEGIVYEPYTCRCCAPPPSSDTDLPDLTRQEQCGICREYVDPDNLNTEGVCDDCAGDDAGASDTDRDTGLSEADGPECETCGRTTCPDAQLAGFSEPVDCEYAPIYAELRAAKDCDYGCGRDFTNQELRLWLVPAVEQMLAARARAQPEDTDRVEWGHAHADAPDDVVPAPEEVARLLVSNWNEPPTDGKALLKRRHVGEWETVGGDEG